MRLPRSVYQEYLDRGCWSLQRRLDPAKTRLRAAPPEPVRQLTEDELRRARIAHYTAWLNNPQNAYKAYNPPPHLA